MICCRRAIITLFSIGFSLLARCYFRRHAYAFAAGAYFDDIDYVAFSLLSAMPRALPYVYYAIFDDAAAWLLR